jgi:hypothetical protein
MVGEILPHQFRDRGVAVVECGSGNDLTVADEDYTRTTIRQILGVIAKFEKAGLVAKLKAARQRQRRTEGRCEGL